MIRREGAVWYVTPSRLHVALVGLCVVAFIAINVWLITQTHEARRQAQHECREARKVLIHARPHLQNIVELADPCRTLARMRGEEKGAP